MFIRVNWIHARQCKCKLTWSGKTADYRYWPGLIPWYCSKSPPTVAAWSANQVNLAFSHRLLVCVYMQCTIFCCETSENGSALPHTLSENISSNINIVQLERLSQPIFPCFISKWAWCIAFHAKWQHSSLNISDLVCFVFHTYVPEKKGDFVACLMYVCKCRGLQ